ncbi:MAG: hypothetical protein GY926_07120 [bacterium]|nr:hypothetical protein [bacterium]
MFQWPSRRIQTSVHYRLDEAGRLVALDPSADPSAPACVHLPPGLCLLRRLSVTGLRANEIEPALALWAEESLPDPVENYAWDSWVISADVRGLVAVPRAPLDQARKTLEQAGTSLRALRVPELCAPVQAESAVIFWATPEGVLACFWDQQVMYEWQSFPSGPPTRAALEQAAALCQSPPARVYRYGPTGGGGEAWGEVHAVWPNAEWIPIDTFDPAAQPPHDSGPAFRNYLHEFQRQPATGADKRRLGLALAGACLTGFFLFHADVAYREQQVEQLRHQVSLLKIKANRSEKLAARSGKTLRQLRALRAMTIERKGVTNILQVLGDSLPPRVKIETLSVERSGMTALDGIAETELDITSFLQRLRLSPLLRDARLSFSEKETDRKGGQALVRFRLEVRWAQPLLSLPEA